MSDFTPKKIFQFSIFYLLAQMFLNFFVEIG